MAENPTAKPDKRQQRALIRRLWQSAKLFWTGDQKRIAWMMTAAVVVLVVAQLAISYRINVWNREIFDALEKKTGAAVMYQSGLFVPLAAISTLGR